MQIQKFLVKPLSKCVASPCHFAQHLKDNKVQYQVLNPNWYDTEIIFSS